MIVPLVNEVEWKYALNGLPEWKPRLRDVLIVAPHPDDETLGAGGLIASLRGHGGKVVVAAVTDGEKAYPNEPGLALIRGEEQSKALARLGVLSKNILRFRLPDSDIASHEEELLRLLQPLVTAETLIVAPWRSDFHPDHEACGRAAGKVASQTGASMISYFFWAWHRGTLNILKDLQLFSFPLTHELLQAKLDALGHYCSQLLHESGEPILPEYLLGPARRPFEVFSRA